MEDDVLERAGPDWLSRRQTIQRIGAIMGRRPLILSIPVFLGTWIGRVLDLVMSSPPVTEDMIDLLDHDDEIDSIAVAEKLGIELTALDVVLARVTRHNKALP